MNVGTWKNPFAKLDKFEGVVADCKPPDHFHPKEFNWCSWYDMEKDHVWQYDPLRKFWFIKITSASRDYRACNKIRTIAGYPEWPALNWRH